LDEVKFEGADYLVGETTKRVFDATEKFLGYAGIGKAGGMGHKLAEYSWRNPA
jgi:hypothetical protein